MSRAAFYLLDTSVLLHLVRGGDLGRFIRRTYELDVVIRRPLISIVTHGEILAIADRQSWGGARRAVLVSMLGNLITLDLNDPVVLDRYVAVDRASRGARGGARILSHNDMWIAATAAAAGATLLTSDQDFKHLQPEVCRVEYVAPSSVRSDPPPASQPPLQ